MGEWGEFRQPFVPYFADYKHKVNHDNAKEKAGGATYRFAYTVLRTLCKRKQNGTCAELHQVSLVKIVLSEVKPFVKYR